MYFGLGRAGIGGYGGAPSLVLVLSDIYRILAWAGPGSAVAGLPSLVLELLDFLLYFGVGRAGVGGYGGAPPLVLV